MGFSSFGWTELLLILGVALIIFGPGKLPELGKTLGKTIREFKGAVNNIDADIKKEVNDMKADIQEVKDTVDLQATITELQNDIKDAVKVEDNTTAATQEQQK